MKCICKEEIIEIVYYDGKDKKVIYMHPDKPGDQCEFRYDGLRVEITDQFMQMKFQELIKEENKPKSFWQKLKGVFFE